jgi:UDP-N-acetylmuramoyl-tripeptide--D-alanyl-D-alanine ligase
MKLGGSYRKSLARTKVIAVCGSNGKTTTTRLIDHVLSQFFRGTASKKSFNNAVGVPLTILSAKENDQYLVCEVGTNAPGEIAQLGEVVQPDIAVITSIGREHLEKLGDLAGVAKEEAAILKFVRPKGCVVATGDAPELREHLAKPVGVVVTFGRDKSASLRLTSVQHEARENGGVGLVFTINGRQEVRLPLVGEHNALNAIAALAVARRMGADDAKAAAALANAGGAEMRLARVDVAGVHVLNDAYNANPDSMLAAMHTATALRTSVMKSAGRLVLVLGEMLELGTASEASHRLVAKAAAGLVGKGVDLVVLVGAGMKPALDELNAAGVGADRACWMPDADEPSQRRVLALLRAGDIVLLKGSRRVRLERVLEALTAAGSLAKGSEATGDGAAGFCESPTSELKPAAVSAPSASMLASPA